MPDSLEAAAQAGDRRAQVGWAAELDARGLHYEALQFLSRAAGTHDPEALRVLGAKLVLADHAPYRPKEGLGMVIEAAGRGDGPAAGLLSVMAAGGFHLPQSWRGALDQLQRAAELGWEPAREQLLLMASGAAAAVAEDARSDPEVWRHLKAGIDLDAWLGAPAATILREGPRILAVQDLAPPQVCDWIVGQCEGRLVRAEVDDPRTGLPVMGRTRTNRVANFGLADTAVLNLMIQHRIGAVIGAPLSVMEAFAVLNYQPGEEASDHFDYLDPSVPAYAQEIARVGQRMATALLYLNDDYQGGETEFCELGLKHRGAKGDGLIFFSVDAEGRPDPRTRHAGRPPLSGEKWVLSQFVRDRPMIPANAQ